MESTGFFSNGCYHKSMICPVSTEILAGNSITSGPDLKHDGGIFLLKSTTWKTQLVKIHPDRADQPRRKNNKFSNVKVSA